MSSLFKDRFEQYDTCLKADYYGGQGRDPFEYSESGHSFLNHAAFPFISTTVAQEIGAVFASITKGRFTESEAKNVLANTRFMAAEVAGLPKDANTHIGIFPNTTEAISAMLRFSGILHKGIWDRCVLTTTSENPSLFRALEFEADYSNADKNDPLTTYQLLGSVLRRNKVQCHTKPENRRKNELQINMMDIDFMTDIEIVEFVKKQIREKDPDILIVSYVLRSTGRVMPIKEIVQAARAEKSKLDTSTSGLTQSTDLFIGIDAAQALGNIPKLDLESFYGTDGIDACAACTHKGIGGPPVGLLYLNPNSPRIKKAKEGISKNPEFFGHKKFSPGTFHYSLGIPQEARYPLPLAEMSGALSAVRDLKNTKLLQDNGDFTRLHLYRSSIRQKAIQALATMKDVPIAFPEISNPSSFILSFTTNNEQVFDPSVPRIYTDFLALRRQRAKRPSSKERRIATALDHRHNTAITYLAGYGPYEHLYRMSFHPPIDKNSTNTVEQQILHAATAFRQEYLRHDCVGAFLDLIKRAESFWPTIVDKQNTSRFQK